MKEKLHSLLDCAYEFVALTELAISRGDADEALLDMIRRKAEGLAAEAGELGFADSRDGCRACDAEYSLPEEDEEIETPAHTPEIPIPEAQTPEVKVPEPEPAPVKTQGRRPCPVKFTLNDRFLFTRELFGGDRRAMDQAVERLSRLGNLAEVERECARYGWEEENKEARRFMAIVAGQK